MPGLAQPDNLSQVIDMRRLHLRKSRLPRPRRDHGRMGEGDRSSTRLVLIRHGEADCNVARVFGGPAACTGLSARGRSQVEALRDRVRRTGELRAATALYASTLPRAVETAEILRPALGGLPVRTEDDLCELHPGQADGMTFAEYEVSWYSLGAGRWVDDPSVPAAPGAESWAEFCDRVSAVLHRITDEHAGGTVVVAGHGGVVDASLGCFLPMAGPYRHARLFTTNASMTEWLRTGDAWRLLRYNDAAHLLEGTVVGSAVADRLELPHPEPGLTRPAGP